VGDFGENSYKGETEGGGKSRVKWSFKLIGKDRDRSRLGVWVGVGGVSGSLDRPGPERGEKGPKQSSRSAWSKVLLG